MKDVFRTNFYLICAAIFQTSSTLTIKLYLNIYKNQKSHPYILTCIYFITYLIFSIKYFYEIPNQLDENLNQKSKSSYSNESEEEYNNDDDQEKPRVRRKSSIDLYKRNSVITLNSQEKSDSLPDDGSIKKNCRKIKHYYCWKKEIVYPSILLGLGYGINIYSLGKINIILYQVMNGCVLICQFKLMKTNEIYNIKPQRVAGGIIVVMSILGFLIYHLIKTDCEVSYLFFVLFSFLSDIAIGFAKFYNYSTIQRHSLSFIILSRKMFFGKDDKILTDEDDNGNENINEENNDNNSEETYEEKYIKNENLLPSLSCTKTKNDFYGNKYDYYCYEKIVFYEGILCFFGWLLLVFCLSFVKCPDSFDNIIKEYVCNNCTTVSGYESFFDNYEMNLIDIFEKENKSQLLKTLLKYPIFSIVFIIILIVSEFFNHVCFQNVFYGKYKTKCVLMLTPTVAIILWIISYYLKKFSLYNNSIFYYLQIDTIKSSEIVSCGFMILGSFVSYLKIV